MSWLCNQLAVGKACVINFLPTSPTSDHCGLMADQSLNLSARRIHTTFLGSAQKDLLAVDWVYQGECDVVYVMPEHLFNTGDELQYPFAKLTKERRIGLVAADEAHLV